MRKEFLYYLIYKFVSRIIVFPIYRFIFRGNVVGSENIPNTNSFILVSNHGNRGVR